MKKKITKDEQKESIKRDKHELDIKATFGEFIV